MLRYRCLPTTDGSVVYNVYFAARCSSTKQLSVGVATGPTPLGPFTAAAAPLVGGTDMGYIGEA